MPDVVETSAPAPIAGYSLKEAAHDLVAGAFRSRQPAARREDVPIGWAWQVLLVAFSGFVSGIDVYLREPFKASDLPPELVGWLSFFNIVGNPLISIIVAIASWLLMLAGGRVISFGRFGARDLGSGIALGWLSATLPILFAIAVGLGLGISSEALATIIMFLLVLHLVPSVAESCGVTVSQAFWTSLLGPLAVILIVALCLLAFGFSGKLMGIGFSR